jgi:heme o synthase
MFYFYAPLSGVGVFHSATFLAATQAVAMSS